MVRFFFIFALLGLSLFASSARAVMIIWIPGSSPAGDWGLHPAFKPENCGFSGWTTSFLMDQFTGENQSRLIELWGAPKEDVPGDKGGHCLVYKKVGNLNESFLTDSKGVIFSWRWSGPAGGDNMKAFVEKVESLAYSNDCAGYNTVQKSAKTMKFVRDKAAEFGLPLDPGAHFEAAYLNVLGFWYANGIHYKKDPVKAFQNYFLSAFMCDPAGEDNLGRCYREGLGVAVNLTKARVYFTLSKVYGFKAADADLDQLKADHPEVFKKSDRKGDR